ncbi:MULTISPECIES: alpha/beta fold hydrolase [unclassified Mycolicibacterium]|uniref:alpha/beta fold hydrolase n=1 Tax=unclassified Mycolicibacterium TaxID=2636767 RepID=UPI0012DF63FE|nr:MULTISPECIES: alpha/beta hydrolase [unclassified Mycolicibacterium]MUL81824.1 alpha/beta hydrolase [Mycolicibacterium sp. CBMA 329]MUL87590.1 alpha/beta hydrolase [Mycolicibacterium sp. CBMA 331]MUL99546.1 alpha/beta hydrolase [Mycolicibacterium sp. CBMA 334]MUM26564.1 alpha/beta hydrolase [Mycolicibacterium sp. CBMA 295]MUM37887.1 alpha/beta hydrolase [Mycolicibacterium sp. CBMA 247]
MQTNEIPETRYAQTWNESRGEIKFLTRSDGSRLRYYTAGTGPPLVLLHTVRTQLDYFQRVIPQLWDSFTVYALDLPGMGWSDISPTARYEEPDLRSAVVEFVTGLDRGGVTLAGESLGAALALSAAAELKDRVSRVVAFNPYDYPGGVERGNWFARFIGTSIRLPALGPVFAAMENRPILKGVLRGGFVDAGKLPNDFLVELRRSGSRKGYPKVARAVMRNLNGLVQARPRYADVAVPVTLVYSEQDWSRPAERDHVANLLADVHRITLPHTGHFSALERPTDMARILTNATRHPTLESNAT